MITMPSEIKNVSFESEILLTTNEFCNRYSQFSIVIADFIRIISARAPSEKGHNCWPKYESTCDFLPNHDASKNNAADQSGPSGLITLTHMQCEGGFTYVKLTGDLSCPNCDSNMKVKILFPKKNFFFHEFSQMIYMSRISIFKKRAENL